MTSRARTTANSTRSGTHGEFPSIALCQPPLNHSEPNIYLPDRATSRTRQTTRGQADSVTRYSPAAAPPPSCPAPLAMPSPVTPQTTPNATGALERATSATTQTAAAPVIHSTATVVPRGDQRTGIATGNPTPIIPNDDLVSFNLTVAFEAH